MALQPVNYIPTQQQPVSTTTNQLEQLRQWARALVEQQKYHYAGGGKGAIGAGLDNFTKALMSGMAARRADELEQARNADAAPITQRFMTGDQTAAPAQPPTQTAGGEVPATSSPFPQASSQPSPQVGATPPTLGTQVAALGSPQGLGGDSGPSPSYFPTTFKIESGNNPYAKTGSNRGLAQFGPEEERRYGINDSNRHKPEVQERGLRLEANSVLPNFVKALGRKPDDSDYYLAHQQGPAGSIALLKNPNMPAWQAIRRFYPSDRVAQQAVMGNVPRDTPLARKSVNDLTSQDFVDMWKAKYNRFAGNTQPNPGAPIQVAENRPRAATGAVQSDVGDLINALMRRGMSPDEASRHAEQMLKLRTQTMPQFPTDPATGLIMRQEPGMPPSIHGPIQGYPGTRSPLGDIPGADVLRQPPVWNPNTRQWTYPPAEIVVPRIRNEGVGPQSQTEPTATPAPPPQRAIAGVPSAAPTPQNAPVAAVTPSGANMPVPTTPQGILGATPPSEEGAPVKVASNDPYYMASHLFGDKQAQGTPPPAPSTNKLAPNPPEVNLIVKDAESNPSEELSMPDIVGPAFKKGTLDALRNIKPNTAAQEKALAETLVEQRKEFAKYQTSFRDAAATAGKLQPSLKYAVKITNSPDFEAGPVSGLVTLGRGLREQLGGMAKDLGFNNIAEWARNPDNKQATANQVYTKLIAGSVLQSLRGMLGPNAGQFRVQELKLLEAAFGNPNLTLDANKVVMSMIDKINDRNIMFGKAASEYARKHGGLDPSFENAMLRFEEQHPPFSPDEYDSALKLATAQGPTETPKSEPTAPAPKGFKSPPPR
jgi:hypothetical protein